MPAEKMIINGEPVYHNERLDDLHRGGLFIIQNPELFCFGTDAVILSGFARVHKGEAALDLCCGNGIIPLLLYAKTSGRAFFGAEILPESVELAQRSVRLNGLNGIITIEECDIKDITARYTAGAFDVVTANPPYINAGLINESAEKSAARHEVFCTLEDVARAAREALRFGGRFYMVYRPQRLVDALFLLRSHKLEPKALRFVQARVTNPPELVLIEARSGGKPHLTVLPPLIIHNPDGSYTQEAHDIYYGN